ncbi:MAG: hypothetical protein IJB36_03995 [Clostridia bacterium]|nr:hypothetical protein [Clostridia bacterium]
MFYMVSKYGNAHKKVESERKRDELIAMGYHEVEEPVEEERGVEVATATSAVVNDHPVDGQSRGGPSRSETVAPYDGPQQADEPQQVDDPLQMHTTEDDTQATAAIDDDTEEGAQAAAGGDNTTEDDAQAAAGGDNTTEDDAQAVKDPEPATAPEPKPEDKEPNPAKSSKTTGGKTTKGATKSNKAKKNAAEE